MSRVMLVISQFHSDRERRDKSKDKACDEIDDVNRYRPVGWSGPRD